MIPADIPLIQAWELEEILKHAPKEGSVLVPAGDGRGTNAAFRRPANLFPLRFGNDSFKPHHAAAQATGKPCVVMNLPGIAVDVDNPEDLQQLISLPGATRSQTLVRSLSRAATRDVGTDDSTAQQGTDLDGYAVGWRDAFRAAINPLR